MTGIRLTIAAVLLACLPLHAAVAAKPPPLPPLTDPPTGIALPGKFVWADLFTSDYDRSRDFYVELFGLEWRPLKAPPEPYGLFYLDGVPVAGLVYRKAPDGNETYGRWIHYLSVPDVAAGEALLLSRGGRQVIPRQSYPQRGEFAIVAGPDGALVGLMRSSSGDPGDYRAETGDFIWRELFTANVAESAQLYADLCRCLAYPRDDAPGRYLLASQDYLRAAISPLEDPVDTAPGWLGYVRVADVAAISRRALELGGQVVLAPTAEFAGGTLAIIRDPAGGYLGLMAWDYIDAEEGEQ